MRRLSRTHGAGNTDSSRYVGEYPIPNEVESDRENARYHNHDLAEMTLPELVVDLVRVSSAWVDHGKRLDPMDADRRWLERRCLAVFESLEREWAAQRREGRSSC